MIVSTKNLPSQQLQKIKKKWVAIWLPCTKMKNPFSLLLACIKMFFPFDQNVLYATFGLGKSKKVIYENWKIQQKENKKVKLTT
jgi:hypothetical protein